MLRKICEGYCQHQEMKDRVPLSRRPFDRPETVFALGRRNRASEELRKVYNKAYLLCILNRTMMENDERIQLLAEVNEVIAKWAPHLHEMEPTQWLLMSSLQDLCKEEIARMASDGNVQAS